MHKTARNILQPWQHTFTAFLCRGGGSIRHRVIIHNHILLHSAHTRHGPCMFCRWDSNLPCPAPVQSHSVVLLLLLVLLYHVLAEVVKLCSSLKGYGRWLLNPTSFPFLAKELNVVLAKRNLLASFCSKNEPNTENKNWTFVIYV